MVDMEEALSHFQNAVNTGIRVHRLLTDDEMVMKVDYPDGGARITHALIEEQKVIGLVAYAIEPPYEGIECWNVNWSECHVRTNKNPRRIA